MRISPADRMILDFIGFYLHFIAILAYTTYRLADAAIDPSLPFTFSRAFLDGSDFPLHAHDYSELVVMTGGEGLHEADGYSRLVHAADVFVIHAGVTHGFHRCEALSMYNFGFDPAALAGTELVALPGFHALFANMAVGLSRRYLAVPGGAARDLVALGAGVAYLESGLSEAVSLAEAAGRAGLSVNQFIRRFKAAYGIPPYRYLLGLRLDRAALLLSKSGRSVTDIAGDCGFEDANYFSRAFSARFGLGPRAYRRSGGRIGPQYIPVTSMSPQ